MKKVFVFFSTIFTMMVLSTSLFAQLQVGIVLPTKDEERWIQDQNRFQDALKTAGISAQVLFSEKDSAKEKANVETLLTKGIKVLVLCPVDSASAAASADAAAKAGVKVVAYDRLITGTKNVDFYVTFDSFSVGAAWGTYLASQAKGKGNNLYLYAGASSDNNAFIFFAGAWSILQPKIADGTFVIVNSDAAVKLQKKAELTREEEASIIGQVTTGWDPNIAKGKAEAHLTKATAKQKGTAFVLSPNDQTARAIADVFAKDKDVKKAYTTGQDADKASIQYIIDGKQSMTVLKDTRVLVADAIKTAITFTKGEVPVQTKTYNNGVIDVPAKPSDVTSVTQANVKAAIVDSGYYPASLFTGLK
jgi:putative multiple sugar transport system substrate-binding protein